MMARHDLAHSKTWRGLLLLIRQNPLPLIDDLRQSARLISSRVHVMPTDAASAMALARKNFKYLVEARDEEHLEKLRLGAAGYNLSLMTAGWINQEQLDQLTAELNIACDSRRRTLRPEQ